MNKNRNIFNSIPVNIPTHEEDWKKMQLGITAAECTSINVSGFHFFTCLCSSDFIINFFWQNPAPFLLEQTCRSKINSVQNSFAFIQKICKITFFSFKIDFSQNASRQENHTMLVL